MTTNQPDRLDRIETILANLAQRDETYQRQFEERQSTFQPRLEQFQQRLEQF